jgi:hypothetical protein
MLKAYIEQFVGIPYEFPSYHQAIREPYDYYQVTRLKLSFGCKCELIVSIDGKRLHWVPYRL